MQCMLKKRPVYLPRLCLQKAHPRTATHYRQADSLLQPQWPIRVRPHHSAVSEHRGAFTAIHRRASACLPHRTAGRAQYPDSLLSSHLCTGPTQRLSMAQQATAQTHRLPMCGKNQAGSTCPNVTQAEATTATLNNVAATILDSQLSTLPTVSTTPPEGLYLKATGDV